MVNEEFDEEAYLKELENEEVYSEEQLAELQKCADDIKKSREHIENDILSDDLKKLYATIDEIEKERKVETDYFNSLSDKEKLEYIRNNNQQVSEYYKDNNIATVGENLTDEDF